MTQEWNSFLAAQGLAADGSRFGGTTDELLAARDGAVMAPLTDLGLIRVSGVDSAVFLHNLLTNDISGIKPDGARFAGFCTAKGRLLALLLIWREGDDFLLMLPRDILPVILKKLSMYVLRSKVKLNDTSDEKILLGLSGAVLPAPTFAQELNGLARFGTGSIDGGQAIRLDQTRWLLALDPAAATSIWQQLSTSVRPVGLGAWHWLEIAAGQPRVVTATQEAFVPQMLNMELPAVAGVSFTKGCYPGQEIVPLIWALGFLTTFLFGGITGIMMASPAIDFHISDTYFIVAHFHYTIFGTVVFAMFAGYYFWWPKLTGRMLDERLGKIHFWMLFIGFHLTFLVQHLLGIQGMARRYADYLVEEGFQTGNVISTIGSVLLGASMLPFLYNVWKTWRTAPLVTVDDPWGYGNSLEWATSCPPPRHNFNSLPRIRSERPAFDLHHPQAAPPSGPAPDPSTLQKVMGAAEIGVTESDKNKE